VLIARGAAEPAEKNTVVVVVLDGAEFSAFSAAPRD